MISWLVKYFTLRKWLLKLYQQPWYEYFILNIMPYIRFTVYYTSFRGWKYHRGYKILQPGDIILTNDKWKLTSILIPGPWSHAALCIGKDGEVEVAEMTHKHFTKSTFFDLCKEATRVAILRCNDWTLDYIPKVIDRCLDFQDVKYDIKFEYGVESLYCSELIVASDPEHRLKYNSEDVLGIGMKYISPTGLSKSPNCTMVWDSNNEIL